MKSPYIIWLYWEFKPGSTEKPAYLDICKSTIDKNLSKDFSVIQLNQESIYRYIAKSELCIEDLDRVCNIPQKTDYYRLLLLKKYGGVWLDSDMIVFRSLKVYVDKLVKEQLDYIGFGCYYEDCARRENGGPRPANWCMISPPGGKLITSALEETEEILKFEPQRLRQNYHCLGKDLLWKHIVKLQKDSPSWSYHHVSSRCVERDHLGQKLTNDRMLSNEEMDEVCKPKLIFIPIYNTAPGFPDWFLTMNRKEILESTMLIGKLFRYALEEK